MNNETQGPIEEEGNHGAREDYEALHEDPVVTKTMLVGLGAVLVLTAASVLAFSVFSPTSSDEGPYATETFFYDLVQSNLDVESARHITSLAIETEPREDGVMLVSEAFPEYIPEEDEDVFYTPPTDEHIITRRIRAEQSGGLIPRDITATVALEGGFEQSEMTDFKPLGQTKVVAAVDMDGMSFNFDLDTIIAEDAYYFRVNEVPTLFFDLTPVKGQWVQAGELPDQVIQTDVATESDKEEMRAVLQQIPSIIDETNVLTISGSPEEELIDGVTTYRYDIVFHSENLDEFLDEVELLLRPLVPEDELATSDKELAEFRQTLKDPAVHEYIEFIQDNTELSIWVSPETGYFKQLKASYVAAIPSDSYGIEEQTEPLQSVMTLVMTFSDINEPIETEIPAESISIEEATQRIFMPGMQAF